MGREVLLVGRGPLPTPEARHTGFAQLRLAHFEGALKAAGHRVQTQVVEDDTPEAEDAVRRSLRPTTEVVVSAGPYAPGRIAALVAEDRPLWIDVPGDPFAELQAVALASDGPVPATRLAAAFEAATLALSRADALSVISDRQRWAAIGQLGLLGRLTTSVHQELVHTIPIAFQFPGSPAPAPAPRDGGPLRIAMTGAFNSWLDVDTVIRGVQAAMDRGVDLRLVCTGGALDGHPNAGFERFLRWSQGPEARGAVHLTGWLPHEELTEVLRSCHVGLTMDRGGYEPALGSRTRVLFFGWHGVHALSTTCSEQTAALAGRGAITAVPTADPGALAEALAQVAARIPLPGTQIMAELYDPHRTAQPLLNFVERPWRHPTPASTAEILAAENQRLKSDLAAVHGSMTWRSLGRVHRLARQLRRPSTDPDGQPD